MSRYYRRWGITPRPENVADSIFCRRAFFIIVFSSVHGHFSQGVLTFSYIEVVGPWRATLNKVLNGLSNE